MDSDLALMLIELKSILIVSQTEDLDNSDIKHLSNVQNDALVVVGSHKWVHCVLYQLSL